jgi:hypothetical protein
MSGNGTVAVLFDVDGTPLTTGRSSTGERIRRRRERRSRARASGRVLVALCLPERPRVVASPHLGGVSGELRRLNWVDAAPAGERAERAPEVLRRDVAEAGVTSRLRHTTLGDVTLR